VKSAVKSSTVESTASEASMEATAAKAASAKATTVEALSANAVETAAAKAASVAAAAAAAASGRHSWLNQADSRQCEQSHNRFPHHASFLGTKSRPRIKHFRTGIIRQSKSVRGKLTVSRG
jgi:hypothetical protein